MKQIFLFVGGFLLGSACRVMIQSKNFTCRSFSGAGDSYYLSSSGFYPHERSWKLRWIFSSCFRSFIHKQMFSQTTDLWSSFSARFFQETDDYRYFDPKMLRGSERWPSAGHQSSDGGWVSVSSLIFSVFSFSSVPRNKNPFQEVSLCFCRTAEKHEDQRWWGSSSCLRRCYHTATTYSFLIFHRWKLVKRGKSEKSC